MQDDNAQEIINDPVDTNDYLAVEGEIYYEDLFYNELPEYENPVDALKGEYVVGGISYIYKMPFTGEGKKAGRGAGKASGKK